MIVKEARIIVIFNKGSKGVYIFEVERFIIIACLNFTHVRPVAKYHVNCVIHRVVEQTSDVALVRSNVLWVSAEAFAHLENS